MSGTISRIRPGRALPPDDGGPDDVDTASTALAQAFAILDVLTVAVGGTVIPDTVPSTLSQSLFAAMSEIGRARTAILRLAGCNESAGGAS